MEVILIFLLAEYGESYPWASNDEDNASPESSSHDALLESLYIRWKKCINGIE